MAATAGRHAALEQQTASAEALPIAGEPLTPPVLLGAGMIVGGVMVANTNRR